MSEASEIRIICCSICIFEYFALSVFLLFKIKNHKSLGIEGSSVIRIFWGLALSVASLRMTGFTLSIFRNQYGYELTERLSYLITFGIYSVVCYSW